MALKLSVNKGDSVQVIAGADKGKKGAVLEVSAKGSKIRVKVQGVKMMTHFDKEDGRFEAEGFIDYSNIKLLDKAKKTKAKK